MNYSEYIKDKRVCFVGACPNIKLLGLGDKIDSYDIVVKTNGSILLKDNSYYADYGKRCDVLYTNNQFQRETRPLPVGEWKERGLEWLCMKAVSNPDQDLYSKTLNVRRLDRQLINVVQDQNSSAYMGAFIFTDILRRQPKEFYITGIDFFASKNKVFRHDCYDEYIDGYLPDNIRQQGNKINAGKTKDGHNFVKNAEYIKKLFDKYPQFKTDNFIMKLLKGIIAGEVGQR